MQTFLPYPSFVESARVLDNRRLGKQRVEAMQILRTLRGGTSGWKNHPAVRMWRGHEGALALYGHDICAEWIKRGFVDNQLAFFDGILIAKSPVIYSPAWLGNLDFHASHRSNLLRKDFAHYSKFGWTEADDLPYVWPVADAQPKQR